MGLRSGRLHDAVTTAQLADKANKVQKTWVQPPLINGWTNIDGEDPPQYRVDEFGDLEFKGTFIGGLENTIAFNVDTLSRSSKTRYVIVVSTLSFGVLYIQSDGNVLVRIKGGGLTRLSLDGIRVAR